MATVEALLTAEEYLLLPDDGQPSELVRGKVVPLAISTPRHGYYCARTVRLIGSLVWDRDLGRVICNNAGVVTEREPDTVRGPDVSFYSYARLPRGPLPEGYLDVLPEAVFEVHSPMDGWSQVHAKVAEYLTAGVLVVCVHDIQTRTLTVFRAEDSPQRLTEDDELHLPEIHKDCRLPVRAFFE
jgi:Uma2 family endonuclease